MASLVIAAAPFETQDSNQQLKKKKKSTKSDQYMALASQQQHMQHMQPQPQTQLQTMQPQQQQQHLGNYPQPTPGLPATPVNQQEQILKVLHNQNVQQQQHYEEQQHYEGQNHPRSLIQVPTPLTDHGYAQYITQPAANQPVRKQRNREDLLMERVQYMIHLLEAQKMERTDHVMEEFLLYTLLGVFIIYLCDSFSRVGKYQR
jgi:hypothetical protein